MKSHRPEKTRKLGKKSTNQIYLRKNEHGSMAAERGAKWGEVKRNFFPPSRNSIPLVEKEVAGFFATYMGKEGC